MWKDLNKQRTIFVQTWDCELRSCTVFDSSTVVGNTAVHPTILRAYSSYLQHTRGQQSIPVQWQTDRPTVRGRHSNNTGHIPSNVFVWKSVYLWWYLSSEVSTGRPSLSQLMTGSGRPWIWHWNRPTPPSSARTERGCTWKSAIAEDKRERLL